MAQENNGRNTSGRSSYGQNPPAGGQRRSGQTQRSARPARSSQSQRGSQTARTAQPTRSARTAQTQRSAQPARSSQSARPAQSVRPARQARTAQPARSSQSARPAQSVRPTQQARTSQAVRSTQPTRSSQQARPAQPQRSAQIQRSGQAAQPVRSPQTRAALSKKELKRAQKEQQKYQKMMEKAAKKSGKKDGSAIPAAASAAVPAAASSADAAAQQGLALVPSPGSGEPQKKVKGGKKGWRIVFIISLVVFLVGLVSVGSILYSYWQGQRSYSKVAEAFTASDVESPTLKDLKVDWAALQEKNPDTVAWIYIPGTEVNYPVVKAADNSHYLKTDFNGETNWVVSPGAIFMDYRNDGSCAEDLTVMYGHNMNDGSMFSQIAKFDTKDSFNDHRDVYLLTPQGNLRLTSFGLKHGGSDDVQVGPALDAAKKESIINTAIGQSVVAPDGSLPDVSEIGNIYVLSTCDNVSVNGRYLLYCYVAESTIPTVSAVSSGHRAEDGALAAVSEGSAQATGASQDAANSENAASGNAAAE